MSKQQEEMNNRFDEIAVYTDDYGRDRPIPNVEEIKSFLQSEVDLAVAEERKRIVEIVREYNEENLKDLTNDGVYHRFPTRDKILLAYNRINNYVLSLISKEN